MDRKIAFFDIDGTLTSEIDGSIPESTISAIQQARSNGHIMFINTGRCFQNVEVRFREVGFDGYICGCGTHIICEDQTIYYHRLKHEIVKEILDIARATKVDLLLECRDHVVFDLSHPLNHPDSIRQYNSFLKRGYQMLEDINSSEYTCDKFVIWYQQEQQLETFRKVSDQYFDCIDRGGTFREFVPKNHSKATGIDKVLEYYNIPITQAFGFGDSNNDLQMLLHLNNSIAMGNASPHSLCEQVSFVTTNASNDGIKNALLHFHFI